MVRKKVTFKTKRGKKVSFFTSLTKPIKRYQRKRKMKKRELQRRKEIVEFAILTRGLKDTKISKEIRKRERKKRRKSKPISPVILASPQIIK